MLFGCLSLAVPKARAQTAPPFEEYRAWAAENAIPVEGFGFGTDVSELRLLAPVIGSARLVSFSEPFHGAHEPLALRNRLFEYLVREHGFSAIALETGLSPSKLLYDYVLGGEGKPEAIARNAFSYRFGLLRENVDLLQWMRAYNDSVPAADAIRLYGVDLTGQEFPLAYRSLEAVTEFLRRAGVPDAEPLLQALEIATPRFRSDVYPSLSVAQRDQITVTIDGALAYLNLHRGDLVGMVGRDAYGWARRQVIAAHQDNAFLRNLDQAPWNLREVGIADNLRWVVDREGPEGRVLFFAHNTHTGSHRFSPGRDVPVGWPIEGVTAAGYLLRQDFGSALVTIGTYFGEGLGDFWYWGGAQPFPPDKDGLDALLGSLTMPSYFIDLRPLPTEGRLEAWMRMEHESRVFNRFHLRFAPAHAFDAIVYIARLTSAARTDAARRP